MVALLYAARTWSRNADCDTPVFLFQSAVDAVPRSAKARVCLASALHEANESEILAITHLQAALDIKPDYAGAFYVMANIHRAHGRMQKAIQAYELTIKHSLEREFKPDVLYLGLTNLGSLYLQNKSSSQAIQILKEAIKIHPQRYASHANLWQAYANLRDFKRICRVHEDTRY